MGFKMNLPHNQEQMVIVNLEPHNQEDMVISWDFDKNKCDLIWFNGILTKNKWWFNKIYSWFMIAEHICLG